MGRLGHTSVCAIFLLYLSGVTAQLTDMTSCIGDDVVYTCTVESTSHIWNIGALSAESITSGETLNVPMMINADYTLELVARDSNNIIISTLSVTASAELNSVTITCRDGVLPAGQGVMQQTTAMVFDSPAAPGLAVIAVNLTTFEFTITPPSVASQCILNYTITPTRGDGTILTDITVEVADTGELLTTESGFDLCNNTYNFTVVANTFAGPGDRSEVISPEEVDFLTPMLGLTNSGFSVTITKMAPDSDTFTNPADSTVTVERSSATVDFCVDRIITGGNLSFTEILSCRLAGQSVTYCLQFITEQCKSRVAMNTTADLPSLMSSPPEVISSTSDSISLMVEVNEQANCNDVDQLRLTATIAEGTRVITTQEEAFTSGTITLNFESMPPGDYTCSITVGDETEPIEKIDIPCTIIDPTSDPSGAPVPVGAIAGGVVGGIAVIILVLVVIVLIVLLKNNNGKSDDERATELKPRETYQPVADDHPTSRTAVLADDSNPNLPGMYADPKSIPHETAGPTGDEYAMVAKPSKKKKKNESAIGHETAGPTGDEYALVTKPPKTLKKDNEMTDGADVTGDMYSVPDMSKKQKNAGMVYADLNLSQKTRPPPPAAPRGIGSVYPSDNEPVLYSTVQ